MTAGSPHDPLAGPEAALRDHALTFPESHEDFPWGERVVKVRGKVFVFMGRPQGGLNVTLKLPASREFALDLPNAAPTGYGLGKAGWVTFRHAPGDEVDVERLKHWMAESYRAVAPKTLAAALP